jgi:ubiquinone/menaquinone biosynthesis C-methylase UbiE
VIDEATRILAEHLIHWSGLCAGTSFLDVGGGNGSLCSAIEQLSGARGTILDPGVSDGNPPPGHVKGVAEAMPFEDEQFDAGIVTHSAHLFHQPVVAMREMARVLRRGGVVLVCLSSHGDLRHLPLSAFAPVLFDRLLDGVPTIDRIKLWLRRARFKHPEVDAIVTPFSGSYEEWISGMVHIATRAWMRCGCVGPPPAAPFEDFVRTNYARAEDFHHTLLIARRP